MFYNCMAAASNIMYKLNFIFWQFKNEKMCGARKLIKQNNRVTVGDTFQGRSINKRLKIDYMGI